MSVKNYWGIGESTVGMPYGAASHPAYNEIWYTTKSGGVAQPMAKRFFDADGNELAIVSNTYEGGKGVIALSGNLSKISGSAFLNKADFEEVFLPDSLAEVGNSSFEGCPDLKLVDLGRGLQSLGYSVFKNCAAIEVLFCGALIPPAVDGSSAFDTMNPGCRIFVPMRAVEDYKAAAVWSERKDGINPFYDTDTIRVEVRGGLTYIVAGYRKSLYCTFNEMNYGTTATLGYVWYNKDGHELPEPHLLTMDDFMEVSFSEHSDDEEKVV